MLFDWESVYDVIPRQVSNNCAMFHTDTNTHTHTTCSTCVQMLFDWESQYTTCYPSQCISYTGRWACLSWEIRAGRQASIGIWPVLCDTVDSLKYPDWKSWWILECTLKSTYCSRVTGQTYMSPCSNVYIYLLIRRKSWLCMYVCMYVNKHTSP
jgi:hypothetical protein